MDSVGDMRAVDTVGDGMRAEDEISKVEMPPDAVSRVDAEEMSVNTSRVDEPEGAGVVVGEDKEKGEEKVDVCAGNSIVTGTVDVCGIKVDNSNDEGNSVVKMEEENEEKTLFVVVASHVGVGSLVVKDGRVLGTSVKVVCSLRTEVSVVAEADMSQKTKAKV